MGGEINHQLVDDVVLFLSHGHTCGEKKLARLIWHQAPWIGFGLVEKL